MFDIDKIKSLKFYITKYKIDEKYVKYGRKQIMFYKEKGKLI